MIPLKDEAHQMRSCYPRCMLRKHLTSALLCAALVGPTLLAPSSAFADEADAQYRKGLEFMQAGRLQEAEASLEEALRLRPNYAAAELTLGNTLRKLKKCDKAIPHYESVIKLQPEEAEALERSAMDVRAQQEKVRL